MKRILMISVFCLSVLPTFAQGTVMLDVKGETGSAAVPKATSMFLGISGALVGVTLGVPVNISKSMVGESKRMCKILLDDFGGEKSLANMIFVGSLGLPYGITSGVILGTIHGTQRGLSEGYKQPFSLNSLSIHDPEE